MIGRIIGALVRRAGLQLAVDGVCGAEQRLRCRHEKVVRRASSGCERDRVRAVEERRCQRRRQGQGGDHGAGE